MGFMILFLFNSYLNVKFTFKIFNYTCDGQQVVISKKRTL